MKKPIVLIILDGFGITNDGPYNAISNAKTPYLDNIFEKYDVKMLSASGMDVGLPDGQMGNSEVGHLNIGSGRIVYQSLTRINKSIKDGEFFKIDLFNDMIEKTKKNNKKIHIMGLLSKGGVHSHIDHFLAMDELLKKHNVEGYLHPILDGRDVYFKSGIDDVKHILDSTKYKVASISGRYYAMDRDKNYDRIQKYYDVIVNGRNYKNENILNYINDSYEKEVYDEFIEPALFLKDGIIENNDLVIFLNYRPDRAIQISMALTNPDNIDYNIEKEYRLDYKKDLSIDFISMVKYSDKVNSKVAFEKENLTNILNDVLIQNKKRQLRIAETEKYAHVTFFFDGGKDITNDMVDRVLINSPKVATYDMQPEMSAYLVTDKLVEAVESGIYDVIIVNYANCDMVGHTGNLEQSIKAVEHIDKCLSIICPLILKKKGQILLTADHGNIEVMVEDGKPMTSHTTNLVPFLIFDENIKLKNGILSDIAPTILDMMEIKKPKEMTGNSLIVKK